MGGGEGMWGGHFSQCELEALANLKLVSHFPSTKFEMFPFILISSPKIGKFFSFISSTKGGGLEPP